MLVAVSWILSLLGIATTYIFLLGAAMSTVPQKLNFGSALGLAILPVIALFAAVWTFWKGSQPIGRNILIFGVPCLLAIATLLMIASSVKLPKMGGPFTEYYGKDTDQPRYQLEIRPASQEPKEGYAEMRATRGDSSTWYVGEEVLFTTDDLYNTTTVRETRSGPARITLGVHGGAQPRLKEASAQMLGEYWAVLLDGELWVVCRIQEELGRELVIGTEFEAKEASELARGLVWAL